MYGLWILVIIFAIIAIALIILGCSVVKFRDKYNKSLTYVEFGRPESYRGYDYQKKRIPAEELPTYEANLKKYEFWNNIYCGDINELLCGLGILFAVVAVILIFVAIFVPVGAAREVAYWSEFAPMVENTILGSDSLQDIGITEKIIEYNSWLAEARSSQEIYKNFSNYYGIDLSTLEYIKIGQ